jgi:hypothetical protein
MGPGHPGDPFPFGLAMQLPWETSQTSGSTCNPSETLSTFFKKNNNNIVLPFFFQNKIILKQN